MIGVHLSIALQVPVEPLQGLHSSINAHLRVIGKLFHFTEITSHFFRDSSDIEQFGHQVDFIDPTPLLLAGGPAEHHGLGHVRDSHVVFLLG